MSIHINCHGHPTGELLETRLISLIPHGFRANPMQPLSCRRALSGQHPFFMKQLYGTNSVILVCHLKGESVSFFFSHHHRIPREFQFPGRGESVSSKCTNWIGNYNDLKTEIFNKRTSLFTLQLYDYLWKAKKNTWKFVSSTAPSNSWFTKKPAFCPNSGTASSNLYFIDSSMESLEWCWCLSCVLGLFPLKKTQLWIFGNHGCNTR